VGRPPPHHDSCDTRNVPLSAHEFAVAVRYAEARAYVRLSDERPLALLGLGGLGLLAALSRSPSVTRAARIWVGAVPAARALAVVVGVERGACSPTARSASTYLGERHTVLLTTALRHGSDLFNYNHQFFDSVIVTRLLRSLTLDSAFQASGSRNSKLSHLHGSRTSVVKEPVRFHS